jgi:hypothetical protein
MRLIVTRPEHDVTTKYISSWAGEIIEFAKKKGVEVCDLMREKVNRLEFEGRVKKLRPELVFLNGHGDKNSVTGHDNCQLVDGDNHHILAGRITYALSCNSGKELGVRIGQDKGATYIGYSDEFIFIFDRNYLSRPLQDPLAHPFMESSNQVMISLIKGNPAKSAIDGSKNAFRSHYTRLLSSTADPNALQAAQCLWWNMRHQVLCGDGDAKM